MATYTFNTFGDVIDEAYDMLAVDGDSNTFPALSRTNFNKFANRFNKDFIDSVRLRTQEGTYPLTTIADTTLASDATSGATTLLITDATNWPLSGLAIVGNIPMAFTRVSLTLTVSALGRTFLAGESVQPAYAVPADFWRPQSVFLDSLEYGYQRRGDTLSAAQQHFILYGDYIVFPKDTTTAQNGVLHYYKKPTATLTASDTMDIMEMWDYYIIYKLVAHGHSAMYDQERSQEFEIKAEQTKKKARSHFARMDGSLGNAFIPGF
jgi:hypothetical protein